MDLTSGLVVQFVASKWDTIKQNAKNWFRNEDTGNWKRNCHEDITLNGKTEACFQKKTMSQIDLKLPDFEPESDSKGTNFKHHFENLSKAIYIFPI